MSTIVEEGVGKLAMDLAVTDEELLLVVSKRDSEDIFDEEADE